MTCNIKDESRFELGRIGVREAAAAAAIALAVNGSFDIEPEYAYAKGNSTYLSIPISVIWSLAFFLSISRIMEKRGHADLWGFISSALGSTIGRIAALLLCCSFVYCAGTPLFKIGQALESMVYEGVEYPRLVLFILPVAVFLAFNGLEMTARTALCFIGLLSVSVAAAFLCSAQDQHIYRLFPIAGDGAAHAIMFCFSEGLFFIPPLTALLVFGDGLHGAAHARKAGTKAAIAAVIVCFTLQLMLGMLYSYKSLAHTFMPLSRINYLGVQRHYTAWLDKLLLMSWLNGCMLSSAYCIYSAGLLFARAFDQKDVRPAVVFNSLLTASFVLSECLIGVDTMSSMLKRTARYGVLIPLVPLAGAALIELFKTIHGRIAARKVGS